MIATSCPGIIAMEIFFFLAGGGGGGGTCPPLPPVDRTLLTGLLIYRAIYNINELSASQFNVSGSAVALSM